MFKVVYRIDLMTYDGELRVRRYARNLKTAQKIKKELYQCKVKGTYVEIYDVSKIKHKIPIEEVE